MKILKKMGAIVRKGFLVLCGIVAFSPHEAAAKQSTSRSHEINMNSVVDVANAALKSSGIQLSSSKKSWKELWSFRQDLAQASELNEVWRGTKSQNAKLLALWKKNGFPIYDSSTSSFKAKQSTQGAISPELPPSIDPKPAAVESTDTMKVATPPSAVETFVPGYDLAKYLNLSDSFANDTSTTVKSGPAADVHIISVPEYTAYVLEKALASEKKETDKKVLPVKPKDASVMKGSEVFKSEHQPTLNGYKIIGIILFVLILITGACGEEIRKKWPSQTKPPLEEESRNPIVPVIPEIPQDDAAVMIPPEESVAPEAETQIPIQQPTPKEEAAETVVSVAVPAVRPAWLDARDKKIRTQRIVRSLLGEDVEIAQLAESCKDFQELDLALSKCDGIKTPEGINDKVPYVQISKKVQGELKKIQHDLGSGYTPKPEYFENFRALTDQVSLDFRAILWSCAEKMLGLPIPIDGQASSIIEH